jgi:gluconolactonase
MTLPINRNRFAGFLAILAAALTADPAARGSNAAPAATPAPAGRPDVVVDLATAAGVAMVRGEWRYSDARLVETDFRSPGADRKPSGPPNRTFDVTPRAGAADFDDAAWPVIDPASLQDRRGAGRISFSWYRLNITIPERLGAFDTAGSTVVLDTVVDDYAEVWVDGSLPLEIGRGGGPLVAGWNCANRLVIGENVQPGRRIQLAIFGINGPISDPPPNYIWIRSARLEFYRLPHALPPEPVSTQILRVDPAIDEIVPPGATIERLASGFTFGEGPVWVGDGLLLSDPNENRIYKWTPDNRIAIFREASGYSGADIDEYRQPGSNGLALDPAGRLSIAQHGNRRVTRLEPDGSVTVLADRFEGMRLNSPNDLVYGSDGSLYFTDPPFGLPKVHDDPRRELPFTGVFRLIDGGLELISTELTGPNGIALSPDERTLYVANWDLARKVVMRYDVRTDGAHSPGRVFFDLTAAHGDEALDGLKVDVKGNVFVSGPVGVWVIAPDGRHLGTIIGPELAANFAWGDADGRTLYLTARTGLYRIRLMNAGARTSRHGAAVIQPPPQGS